MDLFRCPRAVLLLAAGAAVAVLMPTANAPSSIQPINVAESNTAVVVNLAERKTANQSSTGNLSVNIVGSADLAVDGNTAGQASSGSCSATDRLTPGERVWWQGDLGQTVNISHITIYFRNGKSNRPNDFAVEIGQQDETGNVTYTDCYAQDDEPQRVMNIYCQTPTSGRYIRISTDTSWLSLCEVLVFNRPASEIAEGELRLVNGTHSWEGRVEIYVNGTWGTVCHRFWDYKAATVVCRQLGLNTSSALAVDGARFGHGSGLLFQGYIDCNGDEFRLAECPTSQAGFSCDSDRIAGVSCTPSVTPATASLPTPSPQTLPAVQPMGSTHQPENEMPSHPTKSSTSKPMKPTTTSPNYCSCRCVMQTISQNSSTGSEITAVQNEIARVKKELTVEPATTGTGIRKKISAPDHRASATAGGVVAVTFVAGFVGVIVLLDAASLIAHIRKLCKRRRAIEAV